MQKRWLAATVALAAIVSGCTAPAAEMSASASPQASSEKVDAAVRAVAARASWGIFDGDSCRPLHGSGTDTVVPIASAFKLWVLDALAREIAAGRASWDEKLQVRDDLRSDPSGEVHAMPAGTALTLRRHAELMISISDNTATDHLLARLGRPKVEAVLAAVKVSTAKRNTPLLSTADMARLKFLSPASGDRYLALRSVPERRAFLRRLPAEVPIPAQPDVDLSKPQRIDELEWFATPADLCRTHADLARLALQPGLEPIAEILTTNPGLPPDIAARWAEVRFKGGSEPGVLTFAFWLARPDGARTVVVLAFSDPGSVLAPTTAGEAAFREVFALALETPASRPGR